MALVQALCIVMLIITGSCCIGRKIPWLVRLVGDGPQMVWVGRSDRFSRVVLYNLGTGRISHYIPTKEDIPMGMIKQARFYGYGIFKHEPHPYAPSEDNKFNPLQKIAYFSSKRSCSPFS